MEIPYHNISTGPNYGTLSSTTTPNSPCSIDPPNGVLLPAELSTGVSMTTSGRRAKDWITVAASYTWIVVVALLVAAATVMLGPSTTTTTTNNHNPNGETSVGASGDMYGLSRASAMISTTTSMSFVTYQPVTKPKLFRDQRVNHLDSKDRRTWSHPYFVSEDYFSGPGSPIFVILGGEGPITKILYPFVTKKLAHEFGAYVMQTEHRFYGASQPVGDNPTTQDMMMLFTPEQAIEDYISIIQSVQLELGCSLSRDSHYYCPIVTVGASYPGFLSAIMRLNYGHVIDIAYAASAPMLLNAHRPDANYNAYFDLVSNVAENAWPGCLQGTKQTLKELYHEILQSNVKSMSHKLGICYDRVPQYMKSSIGVFATELMQLVVSINADANMEYYPPNDDALLVKLCKIFTDDTKYTAPQRYANFLLALQDTDDYKGATLPGEHDHTDCFDLQTQLPDGPNATISSADWSGAGWSRTGTRWEFQVCKDLVIKTGFAGPQSMFYPPRAWTLEWLTQHCQSRFGTSLVPEPGRLNELWNFDHLHGSSRILFTNGVRDGWITGSYTESSSDRIVVMNFENGSHHSDLTHEWPGDDTDDIVEGHAKIVELLRTWLLEPR
jgi:Serine carboxypeptidase S28